MSRYRGASCAHAEYQLAHARTCALPADTSTACSETSKSVGDQRARKFTARDEFMTQLAAEAKERLVAEAKGPKYAQLLEDLIVQGVARLEDSDVEVQGRAADAAILAKAAAAAQARLEGSTVKVSNTHIDPRR